MLERTRRVAPVLVPILTPGVAAAATALAAADPAAGAPDARRFQARHELVVNVPMGVERVRVWFTMPQTEASQSMRSFEVAAPVAHRIVRDSQGNELLFLEAAGPEPGPMRVVESFELERREVRRQVDPSETRPYRPADVADKQQHLQASRHVVINDRIRELSAQIVGEERNPVLAARRIYDWVLEHADYWVKDPALHKASPVGSTTYCLDTGTGNCSDFHSLYTSLARAQGIPARIIYGSLFNGLLDGKDADQSYHCWVELWAPEVGWIPADVAIADLFLGEIELDDANRELVNLTTPDGYSGPDPARVDYYFGNLEPRRVTWTHGRDLILEPRQASEPVNALPKAYVEIDGKAVGEGEGWTRKLTYREIPPGRASSAE